MKAQATNRYGQTYRTGDKVAFRTINNPERYVGTIKRFDKRSSFARAYGTQVYFTDMPFVVTTDDLFPL